MINIHLFDHPEALMEAYKTLRDNGENTFTKDETLQELELKCRNIKRFLDARK
jgi:hypothetical protein